MLAKAYLQTTKNLPTFLNAIIGAKAPEKFTYKFLEQMEFTSSNDRLFIALLKALGFLDESGVPTQRYFDFLDQTQSGVVLAAAIEEAYSDLFAVNKKANEMSVDDVKGKLKTLTQGQKSETVLTLMANTFKALCDYADWGKDRPKRAKVDPEAEQVRQVQVQPQAEDVRPSVIPSLHYNVQIYLPESRDIAVYDAIFRSLKEHLWRE